MKKIVLVLVCLVTGLSAKGQMTDSYVEGFDDGFCEGYRSVEGEYSVCPHASYPSYPDYDKNNYKGGVSKGFREGRRAAKY